MHQVTATFTFNYMFYILYFIRQFVVKFVSKLLNIQLSKLDLKTLCIHITLGYVQKMQIYGTKPLL